jgi:hypothetical protein
VYPSHFTSFICEPLVYDEIVYGPLPTGFFSQAAWSEKNVDGSGE